MTRLYIKENKFHARKTEVDGYLFDSEKEAERYIQLKILEKAGEIKNLELQKKYVLVPKQTEMVKGKSKVIEKECAYVADFVYEEDGETVVEDVKGFKKGAAYSVFTIKRKLMLFKYGIKVREV